jgi:hypothetical protein
MASPDQSRKEEPSPQRGPRAAPACAGYGICPRSPPEDEEDVLHHWEAAGVPVSTILFGLAFLRGGAAIVLLEHVALFEGVVDWGLVVRAQFLQHVVEHTGASRGARGPLRAGSTARASLLSRPCVRASRWGFLPFLPTCASAGVPWTCYPLRAHHPRACPSCRRRWPPPPPRRKQNWW